MADRKHVLILTSHAGLGHLSAAEAIAAALQELHPADCTVEIVDPMQDERVPEILRGSSADYDWMVREMPGLYRSAYELADSGPPSALLHGTMAAMLFEVMGSLIGRHQPDAIVTPYPFYQAPLAIEFALSQRSIPLLTVVTDLAPVHRVWFHKAADLCLVSMPAVREQAIKHGLSPDKVKVTGIPVHPDLTREDRPPAEIRAALGWSPDLTTALAVGSKRVTHLTGILRALNHSGLALQLIAVAGGDDALYQRLQHTEWHVPAHVYNFSENMPTLMHAADCIICKAGGLIVSESLACGRPILLTDVIEGQETSNAKYVVDGGAGERMDDPLEGLETVYHWLADGGELLQQCAQNARRLGYPRAAYDAAEFAWQAALRGPHVRPEPSLPDTIEDIVSGISGAA